MNSNTNIAGYTHKGQYFCPSCGPKHFDVNEEVGLGNAKILRPPTSPSDYGKRKCDGASCGKTLVYQPSENTARLNLFRNYLQSVEGVELD